MVMRISLKAMVIAAAVLWGGAILLVGLINFLDPNYGVNFLQMTNSVYPWFHATHSWTSVLGRTLEGALDGAIAGILFAWLYNSFASRRNAPSKPQE
jgi:hypothetical protein